MEVAKSVIYTHNDMVLEYQKNESGLWQKVFNVEIDRQGFIEEESFHNFHLSIAGIPHGFMSALVTGYSQIPVEMKMEKIDKTDEKIFIQYRHEKLGLVVKVEMFLFPDINVIRQFTTVINEGDEPITLTHLSSMCMQGIASDGCRNWDDKNKIKVHYCLQSWQGEGQWRSGDLEELGLYRTSVHPCANAINISSTGSWSTGRYLPMAIIEDMETNKVWYTQVESSANWHIEIGHRSSWNDSKGSLYFLADGAHERFGGWTKKLNPRESYTSVPVAVGCCKGNFNDAVKELTKYRRSVLKPKSPYDGNFPLMFNDYMNCLWADPTVDKLIPLIDAAKKAGAEGYCIDAGWFSALNVSWANGLGDWNPSNDRFGKDGLQGVVNYIKSKGMIPGIWLEMEVCGEDAELGKKPDSWFLMRNGKRVGGGPRWFLNINNTEVRSYLHEVIDRLVSMGIGFIKNDYNECIGNGDDLLGTSAVDGLNKHINAFYKFIDEVREKHPNLILENCASGAMRQDYGMLSHFHMQSTSDQEIYYRYPSVLCGSLAGVLPEQAGNWSYPYPLLSEHLSNPDIIKSEEYRKNMEDGEQTIFNMVNGMCGNMYLSGRIDVADDMNFKLIQEGVNLYKKEKQHIHNSFPFWPIGFTCFNELNSWVSVGLANEDNSRVLLAVWRLGSSEKHVELPIYKWQGKKAVVKQLYPAEGYDVMYYYNVDKGILTVNLSKMYQARVFEVKAI